MPLTLATLTQDTRAVAVTLDQGVLNITYRPGALTARVIAKERAMIADNRATEAKVEILGDVLASWDLTDDGKPLPVDADSLSRLPLTVVAACWAAIQEDLTAPKAKSETPAGGSAPKVTSARRRR